MRGLVGAAGDPSPDVALNVFCHERVVVEGRSVVLVDECRARPCVAYPSAVCYVVDEL